MAEAVDAARTAIDNGAAADVLERWRAGRNRRLHGHLDGELMMSQAQLLQCPDCGHRHDLATLGDVHTFRCDKCGRALKVPAQYRNGADGGDRAPTPAQATAPATARSADATVRQPVVSQIPEPAPQPRAAAVAASPAAPAPKGVSVWRRDPAKVRVPIYWRLLIWIAAIPIGLLVVFQLIAGRSAGSPRTS